MHNPTAAEPWADRLVCFRKGELFEETMKTHEVVTPTQFIQPKAWTFPSLLNQEKTPSEKLLVMSQKTTTNKLLSKNLNSALEVRNLTHHYDTLSGIEDISLTEA